MKVGVLLGLLGCVWALPAPHHANITNEQNREYLVESLPGAPEGDLPVMHAGQIDLSRPNSSELFFWRYALREYDSRKDLIIWFNGGPGCSSMDGAIMEIGPFRPKDDEGNLAWNDGTWLKAGDLLFIDQPMGTGFAYTEGHYDEELTQASTHLIEFLQKYLELFPGDSTKKVYLAGESYAGQYIPYFADRILREVDSGGLKMNLKGLLIGNGWIEPNLQSLSFVPFAVENGLITKESDQFDRLLRQHEKCQNAINDPKNTDFEIHQCDKVLDVLTRATRKESPDIDIRYTCYNVYDYRKTDSYPSCGAHWPEILPEAQKYLNLDDVQTSLNLEHKKKWEECTGQVSNKFSPKKSAQSFDLLPYLLTRLPIMLFSGNKDIICNHVGTEMLIKKLDIGGRTGFSDSTPILDWLYDGTMVGDVRSENNLTFVRVFNSSHMVPYDLPEVSLGLMDLIRGGRMVDIDDGHIETPVHGPLGTEVAFGTGPTIVSKKKDHRMDDRVVWAIGILSVIVACLAVWLLRRKVKSSISSGKKRSNKRVHWEDDTSETETESDDTMLGSVLTKLGYGKHYNKLEGDIELGDVEQPDQFVVSDDEDLKDETSIE